MVLFCCCDWPRHPCNRRYGVTYVSVYTLLAISLLQVELTGVVTGSDG